MKLLAPGLLQLAADGPLLAGNRCRACDEHYFPAAHSCTRCCGTELDAALLGNRGQLWSWTVQVFRPKTPFDGCADDAPFAPYAVGYVELECGLKVESRLRTRDPRSLRIGQPMRLVLEAYGAHDGGEPLHTYAFEPADEESA